MNDAHALIFGTLTIALMLVVLFFSMSSTPAPEEPQVTVPTIPLECGAQADSCRVETFVKSDTCKADIAEAKLYEALGRPLERPECQDVQLKLAKSCPSGCEMDFSTMIMVPGKIEVRGSGIPDESERCEYKGSRIVSIRASCVPAR